MLLLAKVRESKCDSYLHCLGLIQKRNYFMGWILLITCQQQGIIQVSKGLVSILLDFVLLNLSYSRSKQSYVKRQESL